MSYEDISVYYKNSGSVPLASRVSLHVRQKMFRLFLESFKPGPATSILDVGVTSDTSFQESNYFELMYPYPNRIVCVGTEDGSHLPKMRPGLVYKAVEPGQPLPFADMTFDIAFSNAVIEHVGSRAQQVAFVREICRVARAFFITTPNRWFPFEHHTGLPLLHYLPAGMFRRILRKTPFVYWADENHLNILTAGTFIELFPENYHVEIRRIRIGGVVSNLVAVGRTQ
jgi:SAM-dependent methyltransferase